MTLAVGPTDWMSEPAEPITEMPEVDIDSAAEPVPDTRLVPDVNAVDEVVHDDSGVDAAEVSGADTAEPTGAVTAEPGGQDTAKHSGADAAEPTAATSDEHTRAVTAKHNAAVT